MRPRHAVLLTPLECAVTMSILISILKSPITFLESALTDPLQVTENKTTLSLSECALTRFPPATPLECAVTKNTGGGGGASTFQSPSPISYPLSAFFSNSCGLFPRSVTQQPRTISLESYGSTLFAVATGVCQPPSFFPASRQRDRSPRSPRDLYCNSLPRITGHGTRVTSHFFFSRCSSICLPLQEC
jgi:hypothetical protein